jgi:hypothetical protein
MSALAQARDGRSQLPPKEKGTNLSLTSTARTPWQMNGKAPGWIDISPGRYLFLRLGEPFLDPVDD